MFLTDRAVNMSVKGSMKTWEMDLRRKVEGDENRWMGESGRESKTGCRRGLLIIKRKIKLV